MKSVYVLNGPNLNMLGKREPSIYGGKSLADIEADCHNKAKALNLGLIFRQTNHEGVLVDWIQEADETGAAGIIINPGAYGHTSIVLYDAIRAVKPLPVIEVHLTNIHAREPFRHHSMIAPAAVGMICGLGPTGYMLAIEAVSAWA